MQPNQALQLTWRHMVAFFITPSICLSSSSRSLLRDLLVLALHRRGFRVGREVREGGRMVDIVLEGTSGCRIELKQLHLKDGARFASNLVRDLKRHGRRTALGVVYLVDERASRTRRLAPTSGGADRRAKLSPAGVAAELRKNLRLVHPRDLKDARIRRFVGKGHTDLYAFVVRL